MDSVWANIGKMIMFLGATKDPNVGKIANFVSKIQFIGFQFAI